MDQVYTASGKVLETQAAYKAQAGQTTTAWASPLPPSLSGPRSRSSTTVISPSPPVLVVILIDPRILILVIFSLSLRPVNGNERWQAREAEDRENRNSPFTGLRLFALADLGFPPDLVTNDMLLTMGSIPGGVGGERVLTYGSIADAYRCGDTGKTTMCMEYGVILPEGCEVRVGEDGERLETGVRVCCYCAGEEHGCAAHMGGSTNVKVSAGAGREADGGSEAVQEDCGGKHASARVNETGGWKRNWQW
ncbi:hypothetical protein B0H14DRAFT_3478831 [Mycena olivaceomarginata]|nr:hypothetical protein B0H14DRAFT_3478831 [Mycena olivaceomarginata]